MKFIFDLKCQCQRLSGFGLLPAKSRVHLMPGRKNPKPIARRALLMRSPIAFQDLMDLDHPILTCRKVLTSVIIAPFYFPLIARVEFVHIFGI